MNLSRMNMIQKLALAYALMFYFIAALAYIPGLTDENGVLFGLFTLELHDDLLHFFSGLWAMIAGWRSRAASVFYFRTFGVLYGLDGVIGLLFGQGYLDGGIFLHPGDGPADFATRFAANIPHILIGGIAVYIGFVLSRKYLDHE